MVYHIAVIVLSAAIALSLPFTVTLIAQNVLVYWSLIGNEKIFLVSIEIAVAIGLILLVNSIGRGMKDSKLSRIARGAGLISAARRRGGFQRRRVRKSKEKQGIARDIKIIGSTGFQTFANPGGDLYHVIQNCREAKIMLLDPISEGASARAKSLRVPGITPESLREQIIKSIDFLKRLKAVQKNIRLKLYSDVPLLKLAVLGDYIFVRHYHTGLDVRNTPEYVFQHDQNAGGLYTFFYDYFLTRWHDPAIPEYDLDTDELIYSDKRGNESRREWFSQDNSGTLKLDGGVVEQPAILIDSTHWKAHPPGDLPPAHPFAP